MITIIRELFQHCSRVIEVTRNALLLQYYDRCYGLSIFVMFFMSFLKQSTVIITTIARSIRRRKQLIPQNSYNCPNPAMVKIQFKKFLNPDCDLELESQPKSNDLLLLRRLTTLKVSLEVADNFSSHQQILAMPLFRNGKKILVKIYWIWIFIRITMHQNLIICCQLHIPPVHKILNFTKTSRQLFELSC